MTKENIKKKNHFPFLKKSVFCQISRKKSVFCQILRVKISVYTDKISMSGRSVHDREKGAEGTGGGGGLLIIMT